MFGRFTSETIRSRIFFYWEIFGYWFCLLTAAAAAKSLQSCSTLCDPVDSSPPGPLSTEFSRQEHWSGVLFPSPISFLVKVYSDYLFGWLSRGRFCVSRSLSVLSSVSVCGIKLFLALLQYFLFLSNQWWCYYFYFWLSNLSLITFSLFKGF